MTSAVRVRLAPAILLALVLGGCGWRLPDLPTAQMDCATIQERVAQAAFEPAPLRPGERALSGHTASVNGLAFTPDGGTLVSASADGTIRLWRLADGSARQVTVPGVTRFEAVAVSSDGLTLAATGTGPSSPNVGVRVWRLGGGDPVLLLPRLIGLHPAFSPDGQLLAVISSGVTTYSTSDLATTHWLPDIRMRSERRAVLAVFGPGGSSLLVAERRTVGQYALGSSQSEAEWRIDSNSSPSSLAISKDGRYAAVSASPGLWIWRTDSSADPTRIQPSEGLQAELAFTPDGAVLASAAWHDLAVRLFRAADGAHLRTLSWYSGGASSVAFSPDGRTLAVGSTDGTIRLADDPSGWREPDPNRDAPDPELQAAQERHRDRTDRQGVIARATLCARAATPSPTAP